jgi:hypothetical protein
MRAINHALTGAIIGLVVGEPLIAVPAALASHFVCDVIPHYGSSLPDSEEIKSQLFRRLLYADAILCVGLVALLAVRQPVHWWLAAVCAFVAASPDLLSINRYIRANTHKQWRSGPYVAFASRIQWFERPIGAVVEVAWFVAAIILLIPFFR